MTISGGSRDAPRDFEIRGQSYDATRTRPEHCLVSWPAGSRIGLFNDLRAPAIVGCTERFRERHHKDRFPRDQNELGVPITYDVERPSATAIVLSLDDF